MGTGYTRQSAGLIVDGGTIEASHHEDEFVALAAAFDASTGHSHDGTAGEGPLINLSTAVTGTLIVGAGGTGQTSYTDGQLLIGNSTGNTLAKATLTGTTPVTVTNGNGTITLSVDAATTIAAGISELAIASEVNTGTDATRVITPDALAASYAATKTIVFSTNDYTASLATGDGQAYIHIPAAYNGMDIISGHAEVITAGTTGTSDFQIHNLGLAADVFSTKITVDSGETGSDTAAAAAVINTSNDALATNDVLRLDIDAVSTTPPQGVIVTLECRLP
jgi:hypothetical protein